MAIYYLGWIAPQEKVTKRAAMVSEQTDKVREGEMSAAEVLEQMQKGGMSHGKKMDKEDGSMQKSMKDSMPSNTDQKSSSH